MLDAWQMANVEIQESFFRFSGQSRLSKREDLLIFVWAREFTSSAKAPDSFESAEKGQLLVETRNPAKHFRTKRTYQCRFN